MAAPQVSVLIVNYNAGGYLARCVASIGPAFTGVGQTTPTPHEILVADNASADDSIEQARAVCPHARYEAMGDNLGFGKAMNRLAQMASSPWLFLLNPDSELMGRDWYITLLQVLRSHPHAGVIGPKIFNSDGSFQDAAIRGEPSPWNSFCELSGLSQRFPDKALFTGYHLAHLDRGQDQRVHAVSGSAMLIRRRLFLDIGGFDERFFLFAEDLDLCRRAVEQGKLGQGQTPTAEVTHGRPEVWYTSTLSVLHHKGKCSEARPAFVNYHFQNAMGLYFDKHYNRGLGRLLRPFVWWVIRRKAGPKPV